MAFIPVPDTAMFELRYDWDNQRCENTLYIHSDTGFTASSLASWGTILLTWWRNALQMSISSAVRLSEIYCRDLSSQFAPAVTVPGIDTDIGGSTSPSMPNNVTCAISLRTDLSGRSYRGRNYIVGLTEAYILNNNLTSGIIDVYESAYNNLLSIVFDAGASVVVVSRYQGGAPRNPGIATPVSIALFSDTVVDSQRRRLPKRGN